MLKTVKALVLRETRYKETQKILTLLSQSEGKITATAFGAYGKKNLLASSTQHLAYSEFVIEEKNGRYSVKEGMTLETFPGLRTNYANYALGCYFSECVDFFSIDLSPDNDILRLILNSLYALSNEMYPPEQIKASFEMKLMSLSGFRPDFSGCRECGKKSPEDPLFCFETGCLCCRECRKNSYGNAVGISLETMNAVRHVISGNLKSFLSFQIDEDNLGNLTNAAEAYFKFHSERTFGTLDYWKNIK